MELIKRKISLEEVIDRRYPDPITKNSTWGDVLTGESFYVKVFLTQTIDDMGVFTDFEYMPKSTSTPNYDVLDDKLRSLGITNVLTILGAKIPPLRNLTSTDEKTLRLSVNDVTNYYNTGGLMISGLTDSKIDDVKSYSKTNPYQQGFIMNKETYTGYTGLQIVGVDKIYRIGEPSIYVFDTKDDLLLGTPSQTTGLKYIEYTGTTREVIINKIRNIIPTTIVNYIGQGWNQTNTSLSALTKEEYLFGIVSRPEVENDVFIDRGKTNVLDLHLKLSEITNMGELIRYGNGYYKINKQ